MATIAVSAVIAEFLERYPDARSASSVKELALLNRVHEEVCQQVRLYFDTFKFNLVAGTPTYDLDALPAGVGGMLGADIVKVFGAEYVKSAAVENYHPLRVVDPTYKDNRSPGWRLHRADQPGAYYIDVQADDSQVIGLYPKPNLTTSPVTSPVTGYPHVQIHCQCVKTLGTSDNLPRAVRYSELHLAGMCFRWAVIHDREAASGWNDLFQYEKRQLRKGVDEIAALDNAKLLPRSPNLGGVV